MIPEGPLVYTSPHKSIDAYLCTPKGKGPETTSSEGKYIEVKFQLSLAIRYGGNRPPRSVLVGILQEGLPDYLDFLDNLTTHPQLHGVPLIYASSNFTMATAARRLGFNVEKIKPVDDHHREILEDPEFFGGTHVIYAKPEDLFAKREYAEKLAKRALKLR